MRVIIQRVKRASVTVADKTISSIGQGLCVLVGLCDKDTEKEVDVIVKKILGLRLFSDPESDKPWSRGVQQINGEILCVSQFTLYAKVNKGSKPDFHKAMKSQEAESMYAQFLDKLGKAYDPNRIKNGQFGALMDVELVNDGPVTITIDTTELIATNSNGK